MKKNYQVFAVPLHSSEWSHRVWILAKEKTHSFFAKESRAGMSLNLRLFKPDPPCRTIASYHGSIVFPCKRIYDESKFLISIFGRFFSRENPNGDWETSTEKLWNRATMNDTPISTTLTVEEYLDLPWEQGDSKYFHYPSNEEPQPISCGGKNIKPQNFENFSRVYVAFLYFLDGVSLREVFLSK